MEPVTRSQRYRRFALAFREPEAEAPRDRTLAYTRLCLGPGRPIAYPYESAQVEGRLMGAAAAHATACYAEAGLQISTAARELPDHVSVELAFMAHLAAQEERHPDQADAWRERQRRFLCEHLARWLPQFCEKVEQSGIHPLYCEAARAAKQLIEEDVARLASPADAGSRMDSGPGADAPAGRAQRYPNISLRVDVSRCTLCALCADTCRSDALSIHCLPTTLSLAFDPTRCNGCRACLRLCPEAAIAIERGSPLAAPPTRSTQRVASALRVVCPDCRRPHIAAPWLERLAERLGGGESTRQSLARCPYCKAASGNSLPVPVELPQESFASV